MTQNDTDRLEDQILDSLSKSVNDFFDIVRPGDIIYPLHDSTFTFSGYKYLTARKGYRVLTVNRNRSKQDSSIKIESDIRGENAYLNPYGIIKLEREGEKLWESRAIMRWRSRAITSATVWRGYYESAYRPDLGATEDLEAYAINGHMLVELLDPFLHRGIQGQPGDLMVVPFEEYEVLDDVD